MRHGSRYLHSLVAALASTATASVPAVASAVTVVPARAVTNGPAPQRHGFRLGLHHVFGTILAIKGTSLTVQRRNGRLITVDASTAIANDDYSYPLYVGKTVAIDGSFNSPSSFVATHVDAITSLQSLEGDK